MNIKLLAATAAGALTLALAGSANAVTVIENVGGQLDTFLYNTGDDLALTVDLQTSTAPNYIVQATGSEPLEVDGFGFALIDGAPTFSSITLDPLDPLLGFTAFQFTVLGSTALNSQPEPTFKISWTTNLGSGFQFVTLDANKAYELDSSLPGEVIQTITLSNLTGSTGSGPDAIPGQPAGFAQVKQFSFVGVYGAIPEPASWAMMLAGFGGIGAMMRRRRSTAALAV
jgi:hypothetical protein